MCRIFKNELDIAGIECNGLVVVACGNGKLRIRSVNRIHMGSREVDVRGDNDVHFHRADDVTVEHHINVYRTVSLTGEHTVSGNGSITFIGNCPCAACGKKCFVACGADTLCSHLNGGTDGCVLVSAFDHSVIEFGGAGSSGNYHERGRYGTRITVGGLVDNGEVIVTGLSCNVGGGTAAVEVNRFYAACFKHDLRDFFHATAAGNGFLTSVEYHHNDLTGLGDTDSSSGSTAGVIVGGLIDGNLTVFYKGCTEASDTFLYLTLINRVVFFRGTDNGSAVLEDTEEAVCVDGVVFNTAHDEQAAGFTGRHIEACTVGRCDYLIVGNVVGAVGVAVLILCSICLILNTGHFPTLGGIVIVVVCVEVNVISGDIGSCEIVNHLFAVSRSSVLDLLGNTGSQLSQLAGEYGIIGIFRGSNVVAREQAEVVCERVANCFSEGNEIFRAGEVSRAFERGDELICKIFCINSVSYLFARAVGLQSVGHEVSSAVFVGEILGHIVHDDLSQRINVFAFFDTVVHGLENVHDVICIKVAVVVFLAEAGIIGFVDLLTEALLANESNHNFEIAVDLSCLGFKCRNLEKVNKVTCPTGNVCVVGAEIVVISDIHRAEYVADIRLIAVGESKVAEVLQTGNSKVIAVLDLCVECIFSIGYVFCKVCILVTCHDAPGAGVVAFNTRTDVLDHERCGILCGIHLDVFVCHLFEKSEIINEIFVIVNGSYAESRDHYDFARSAAFLTCPVCFITVFGTGRSLFGYVNNGSMVYNFLLCNENFAAVGAVLTFGKTGVVTVTLDSRVDHFGVTVCFNGFLCNEGFTATTAMAAFGKTGFGARGSNCLVNHFGVAECFAELSTAIRANSCVGTSSAFRIAVSLCGNHFLFNENLVTHGAVLTFGKTVFGTRIGFCRIGHFGMTVCFNGFLCNENGVTYGAVLTFGKTGFGASRRFRRIGHFGVAGCRNFGIHIFVAATVTGMCRVTFRRASRLGYNRLIFMTESRAKFNTAHCAMTCFGTGCAFGQAVTLCRNNRLRNDRFAADLAMAALGKTGFGASGINRFVGHFGVSKLANNRLFNGDSAANRTVLTFGKTGCGASRSYCCVDHFSVSKLGNFFRAIFRTARAMELLRTCFGTGCCFQYFAFNSSVVGDFPIFVCGQGQGNFYVTGTLNELIRYFLSTVCDLNVTVTGNLRTACGGVNITIGCINGTIDNDLGIYEIRFGSGIRSAGSIAYRNKLHITRSGILTPFVCIVNIDVVTFAKCTFCIFTDDDFRTGEECNILIDRDITGYHFNRHVILNTQLIVLGVDAGCTNGHIDGGNGYVTISRDHQSVGGFIVILDNVAVCQVEHRTAACNKCNRRAEISAGHVYRGIRVFRRAGPDGQRNFNVLEIILGKREYAVLHIRGLRTATEVHDLEVFVYARTFVCDNGAATGDEAVCVQRTAVVYGDGAVYCHIDKAYITCGRTAVIFGTVRIVMLCRKADCTVNGNIGTFRHDKCTVSRGSRMVSEVAHSRSCALCLRRIHGVRTVKRNEQGYACGNGVITCGKRSVVHQNESRCAVCCRILSSRIQIVKEIVQDYFIVVKLTHTQEAGALGLLICRANAEPGCAAVLCKDSLNGHILRRNKRKGCSGGNDLAVRVNPTKEDRSALRGCLEFCAGSTVYGLNITVINSNAAYGDGTKSAVIRKGYVGVFFYFNQTEIVHCQCCG